MTEPDAPSLRLVAIIAAYNEEDIIGPAIAHLIEQGAYVYLLDDGSTDRTVAIAKQFADKGLIAVESLPRAGAEDGADEGAGRFSLSRILRRKARLAATLEAGWFINHDADEFRDSPWPHLSLVEAIQLVDRLGWNAIDFEVFNVVPGGDESRSGSHAADTLRRYHPAAEYDRLQIRCWKKTNEPVDLVTAGGHEALFPERRVFPIRFPMRHYPVRSTAQGKRKVFQERLPRFDPDERARGWHVQYDQFVEGRLLLPNPATALVYDREAISVALQIENRLVEATGQTLAAADPTALAETVRRLEAALVAQRGEAGRAKTLAEDLDRQQRENEQLRGERDDSRRQVAEAVMALEVEAGRAKTLAEDLDRQQRENEQLRGERADGRRQVADAIGHTHESNVRLALATNDLDRLTGDAADLARRLEGVYASRSWHVTGPLRAAWRLIGGK